VKLKRHKQVEMKSKSKGVTSSGQGSAVGNRIEKREHTFQTHLIAGYHLNQRVVPLRTRRRQSNTNGRTSIEDDTAITVSSGSFTLLLLLPISMVSFGGGGGGG
jgi:hypothetical protein